MNKPPQFSKLKKIALGRRGTIQWPPHSTDLTPLAFLLLDRYSVVSDISYREKLSCKRKFSWKASKGPPCPQKVPRPLSKSIVNAMKGEKNTVFCKTSVDCSAPASVLPRPDSLGVFFYSRNWNQWQHWDLTQLKFNNSSCHILSIKDNLINILEYI